MNKGESKQGYLVESGLQMNDFFFYRIFMDHAVFGDWLRVTDLYWDHDIFGAYEIIIHYLS